MKDEIIDPPVSHKVAKLAKEKGFQIPTLEYYDKTETLKFRIEDSGSNEREYKFDYKDFYENWNYPYIVGTYISAPTQTVLQTWLRKIHKINVLVDFTDNTTDYHYDYSVADSKRREYHDIDMIDQATRTFIYTKFSSYEEALENGLLEALNLIK